MIVELQGVTKRFGSGVPAVDNLSLEVKKGEFFSLLGPSGCGKTTTLRMVAGFISPTKGSILIEDEKVNHLPPYKRKTSMVFQNYALFPHMTVFENIAFGLKMKKWDKDKIYLRVEEAMGQVKLTGFQDRYPSQLSGGQQQRVAIARAIATNPSVILMDEPLSNLDAKLRHQMRIELKQLQKEIGTTVIYVTHDQGEALALSDRIAILNEGRVEQVDSPSQIYRNPSNEFVATFIGQLNMFRGRVARISPREVEIVTDGGLKIIVPYEEKLGAGENIQIALRPEGINIGERDLALTENTFTVEISYVSYLGSMIQYLSKVEGEEIVVTTQSRRGLPIYQAGEKVRISFDPTECIVLQ